MNLCGCVWYEILHACTCNWLNGNFTCGQIQSENFQELDETFGKINDSLFYKYSVWLLLITREKKWYSNDVEFYIVEKVAT